MKEKKDKVYAVIDTYVDVIQDGVTVQKIKKPVFRDGLCVFKRPPVVSGSVIIEQEKTEVLRPNAGGIYTIAGNDPNIEEKALAMNRYMDKHPIIGPFDSFKDAAIGQDEARPKTENERLTAENLALKAQLKPTSKPTRLQQADADKEEAEVDNEEKKES